MALLKTKILFPELSYKINGICFSVHNELGSSRSEKSYADALEFQLKQSGIKYEREKAIPSSFEGEATGRNVPDFIIEGIIVVDTKAKRIITKEDYFQMKRYLAASGLSLGIIVNFRQKYINPKRVLHS